MVTPITGIKDNSLFVSTKDSNLTGMKKKGDLFTFKNDQESKLNELDPFDIIKKNNNKEKKGLYLIFYWYHTREKDIISLYLLMHIQILGQRCLLFLVVNIVLKKYLILNILDYIRIYKMERFNSI